MGKFVMFLIVVSAAALGYFGFYNRDYYTVAIWKDSVYEVPKYLLILISSSIGGFLVMVAFVVKDTRKYILMLSQQKKIKREDRIKGLYSRALDAYFAQRWEDAQAILEQILKDDPERIDAILKLGSIYYNARDYSAAFSYYKRAYLIDSSKPEILFAMVDVKEAIGAHKDALAYIDEILDIDEDNLRALYKKRDLLEKLERWDDLFHLQRTIIKSRQSEKERKDEQDRLIGYKYELGRYSLENGDMDKAQKSFRTLLRLDRYFIPAHLGLAEVILREENADDAVNYLENIYLQTHSLIVLARLEDMLINLGEPAKLLSIYKSALVREPDNNNLKLMLGKLYHRLEMLDDAIETLQSIDGGSPSYPEISKIMGNIYLKRNQADKAAEEFKKVIDIKKAFRVPYCCSQCGFFAVEWTGRCPSCRNWNTFQFDLFDTCKIFVP